MRAPRWTATLLVAAFFLPAEALAKSSSRRQRSDAMRHQWLYAAALGRCRANCNGCWHHGDRFRWSGTYIQQPDGTSINTITWKLRSGSDSHYGAIVTRSKNPGFIEGARDFRGFTNTSTSYVPENGRIGYAGSSAQGVVIGVCESVRK